MNSLTTKQIQEIIPHRHPFLLVDYIEDFEPGEFGIGYNKCRFKGKVKPGDKLRLETKIIRHKGPMGVGEAVASVDGKVVAQAELTFMVGAAQ